MISHREILDRLFEAWRSGDALYAVAHFSPDASYGEAGRDPLVGRQAILEHFTRFFRDGPPWRLDVDGTIVEGNRAAVVYRFASEREPDGWRERAGCAVVVFDGGAITEWREYQG